MNKAIYEKPQIEVSEYEPQDVMTTSGELEQANSGWETDPINVGNGG